MIPLAPPASIVPAGEAKDFQARCAEFSKAKDWKGLEAFARAYVDAHPKDAPSRAALGYALFALDRSEEGRKACEEAIALDPTLTDAYLSLGLDCALRGDRPGVLALGERVRKATRDGQGIKVYFKNKTIFCAAGEDQSLPCLEESGWPKVIAEPRMLSLPRETLIEGNSGSVVMELTVGQDGVVIRATVICGSPQMRSWATNCAKGMRFEPYILNGDASSFRARLILVYRRG